MEIGTSMYLHRCEYEFVCPKTFADELGINIGLITCLLKGKSCWGVTTHYNNMSSMWVEPSFVCCLEFFCLG